VSAEVVLANGTVVTASKDSHPDLFWVRRCFLKGISPLTVFKALRGAAPSYGIVTQWVFDTLPAPKTTVTFNINLPEFSDTTSFVSAFKAYQNFVRNAPNEMGMSLAFR
jgi:FAD/FMN-containing dehydrogenase